MRFRLPFRLFRRRIGGGLLVWYYTTFDESGQRRQFSTGCIRKGEANKLCLELFKRDRLLQNKSPLFKDYTADWFDYDKCLYIKGRLLRGFTYSRSFADGQRSNLQKTILPFFKNYPLDKITVTVIEKWLASLKAQGYANISANHLLSTLKVIINEAFRRGDMQTNPVLAVRPLADDCKKKGVFSKDEVQKLFAETNITEVWGGNEMYYALNLLAVQTGMRLGEIQALLKENIHLNYIDIKHSWDRTYGIKGTKTNKPRQVPISIELFQWLLKIANTQNEGEYIFSVTNGKTPVDHSIVYKWFRRALEKIGIAERHRLGRNLSFHSWRHYVNSQLSVSGVADSVVQSITGHSDIKMKKHYTHVQLNDMGDARKILEKQGGSK
jgi:integrase